MSDSDDSAPDFATLLDAARRGDALAMEQLVRLYEPQLRIVARARLGAALRPILDTTDLVQSVHRSLLVGLRQDKFDISTPQNLLALALTMVRRKIARHWRRQQRQRRLESGSSSTGDLALMFNSLSTPPDDPARAVEFHDQVRHLCATLDATERRLVEMRLEGYSTVEVARTLGVDSAMLRARLARVRKRLRETGVLTEWL